MRQKLVVLDNIYPEIRSGWRVAEYDAILERFSNAEIRTRRLCTDGEYERAEAEYFSYFPQHRGRIKRVSCSYDLEGAAFCYTMFLEGAYNCVLACERYKVPFAFVLYPGGDFALDNEESDRKLARVLNSPMFAGLVATQPVTFDYLTQKHGLPESLILRTYPGPMLGMALGPIPERVPYRRGETFGVGFIGFKYSNNLRSKGYDFFIASALELCRQGGDYHFDVVGNYEPSDIDLGPYGGHFTFHGSLPFLEMRKAMLGMQVVLSPNVPSALAKGNFDGFPTASCIEAGIVGTIIIATDPLGLNRDYRDGEDIIILRRDFDAIRPEDVAATADMIRSLATDPERVNQLSVQTAATFRRVFSPERQIKPRLDWLEEHLLRGAAPFADDAERWRKAAKGTAEDAEFFVRENVRLQKLIVEAKAYMDPLREAVEYHSERAARFEEQLAQAKKPKRLLERIIDKFRSS